MQRCALEGARQRRRRWQGQRGARALPEVAPPPPPPARSHKETKRNQFAFSPVAAWPKLAAELAHKPKRLVLNLRASRERARAGRRDERAAST